MKKFLFIIFILLCNVLYSEGIFNYPLSRTDEGLYLTGKESETYGSFVWGKHQNLSISPNYFDSYGFRVFTSEKREFNPGIFFHNSDLLFNFLMPSVSNPTDDLTTNIKYKLDFNIGYLFKIKLPIEKLSLYAGPYSNTGFLLGSYSQIENILIQSFFYSNIGVEGSVEYDLMKTIRFGVDYNTSIIGLDLGRNGYNKDFTSDINLSTFNNFLNMKLSVYTEYDLSRTESIRLFYTHSAFSEFDDNNTIISGEHSIGLGLNTKLVR
ncbi:MAG: hypothetical protein JXR64_00060 [Spirochaetales bacterium]|nr:hypothetical protein [Spirochaetales bacterium]